MAALFKGLLGERLTVALEAVAVASAVDLEVVLAAVVAALVVVAEALGTKEAEVLGTKKVEASETKEADLVEAALDLAAVVEDSAVTVALVLTLDLAAMAPLVRMSLIHHQKTPVPSK